MKRLVGVDAIDVQKYMEEYYFIENIKKHEKTRNYLKLYSNEFFEMMFVKYFKKFYMYVT